MRDLKKQERILKLFLKTLEPPEPFVASGTIQFPLYNTAASHWTVHLMDNNGNVIVDTQ